MDTLCLKIVLLIIAVAYGEPPKKIVRGTYSVAEEFPYQVSLTYNRQHFCGGSIISTRHILTAAHCLVNFFYTYNQIFVLSGTTNLQYGGTYHRVYSMMIHPGFINHPIYMYANDIAVLTLETSIQLDAHHHIIKLASKSEYGGKRAIVSGWGMIYQNSNQAFPYLLKLTTNIINATYCQYNLGRQLYNAQVCALASYDSGTCQGDSGGPLAVGRELVGVVSFGYGCGAGIPDVYTFVYEYKEFIEGAINESGLSREILYPGNNQNNYQREKVKTTVTNPTSSQVVQPDTQNSQSYYLFANNGWYLVTCINRN